MKARKMIVALLVGVLLMPVVSFAQTTPDRDALIQQLIAVLMQQIQLLQEKLEALENAENVAERVYEEKEAEKKAAEEAEIKKIADEAAAEEAEEEAALQKKLDAIERDGYYIECNDDGYCAKWVSEMCWYEKLPGRNTYSNGKSCGG